MQSKADLIAASGGALEDVDVQIADIAGADAAQQLENAFTGCNALVVCTSAVPQPVPGELTPNGWPKYCWKAGQSPELVSCKRTS